MKFDPTRPWVIGQPTTKGYRYFTDKISPISPDAWTPDIRKAARFTGEQATNMREHCQTYTWG
jgi:hypothetical protein